MLLIFKGVDVIQFIKGRIIVLLGIICYLIVLIFVYILSSANIFGILP